MFPLPKVIEQYRASWMAHDIAALSDLFEDKFEYEINGASRFRNKRELRSYWCKNKFRQVDLDLKFLEPREDGQGWDAIFSALFYNPIRFSITSVTGVIRFELNAGGDKITKLSERYDKSEHRSVLYSLSSLGRKTDPVFSRIFRWAVRPLYKILKSVLRHFLTWVFVLGVAAVVYVTWIHTHVSVLDDNLVTKIKPAIPFWFAGAYVLQQLLPIFKSNIAGDIAVGPYAGRDDLYKIVDHIKDADFVQIISGDFSFIDEDPELENILRQLAFARKLELFSYKSQKEVEEELLAKTKSREIMLRLQDEKRIHYNCPVRAKITLVERGGQKKMLFRFAKDEEDRKIFFMGAMRPTQNTTYLLSVVDQMIVSMRSNKQTITPGPTDST